jgi:flagellar biogenesis protein FliO
MNRFKLTDWLVRFFIFGATVFFGIRLFKLINKHAVNVLFFDQWDFLTPLFKQPTMWEMFTYQHGPHRQGLGLFVSQAIGLATNWNTRAECFGMGFILVLVTIAALILKKRLFGKLTGWDVLIPSITLSFTQIEAIVLTPNPAHGALPILLTLIGGLLLTVDNKYLRYFGLVFVTFFATYTGFGIFLGIVTPIILFLSCLLHWFNKEQQPMAISGGALVISIISFGSFFIDYVFSPVQDCFQLPYEHLQNYVTFVSLELAMFLGFDSKSNVTYATIIGLAMMLGMVVAALFQVKQLWDKRKFESKNLVILLLIGFSLLFAVNSASGRICNGLEAAQSSRYMTLLIPCCLGLYFALQEIPQIAFRTIANIILVIGFIILPIYALKQFNKGMEDFSQVKKAWAACYVVQESIEECNKVSGNVVYPSPESTHMQEKLNLLKVKRYNLFTEK